MNQKIRKKKEKEGREIFIYKKKTKKEQEIEEIK